jgi:RNA polymerase sigma-70 factor, ECF subfamily
MTTTQFLRFPGLSAALTPVRGRSGKSEYHVPAPGDMTDKPSDGGAPEGGNLRIPSEAESSFDLLLRARDGDDDALGRLCSRYLPRLQRSAHGRLRAWARSALETQDLAQETLIQAVRNIKRFEPRHEGAFQAYLRQMLLNRIRDEIRRGRRRGPTDSLDTSEPARSPSPLEEAIGQEVLDRYEAALQNLRPEDREAIIARIKMGLDYAEVAEVLGKPSIAAAHMAVSRALVKLAKEMARGARLGRAVAEAGAGGVQRRAGRLGPCRAAIR